MKNHKHIYILLCLQLTLSVCCFDVIGADDQVIPSKPPKNAKVPKLFKTIEKAKTYILKHQNQDGGWPLLPYGESDVEITALAIWALTDAGYGTGSRAIRQGVRFLRNAQNENGSWNNNTAYTTFALVALTNAKTDADARLNGLHWVKKAQNLSGSWGRRGNSVGHVLHTSATLVGLKYLGFNHKHFKPILIGMEWLENWDQRNFEGYWTLPGGTQSDIYVTAWALQGLVPDYNVDEQIAWLKQFQNKDGGYPRFARKMSDPEVTAASIMALAANDDPLNTRRIAISYLTKVQTQDGGFISNTPIEIRTPKANLQSTCMVLIAIHSKVDKSRL